MEGGPAVRLLREHLVLEAIRFFLQFAPGRCCPHVSAREWRQQPHGSFTKLFDAAFPAGEILWIWRQSQLLQNAADFRSAFAGNRPARSVSVSGLERRCEVLVAEA